MSNHSSPLQYSCNKTSGSDFSYIWGSWYHSSFTSTPQRWSTGTKEQSCLTPSCSAGNFLYLQEKLLQGQRCWKKGGSKEQSNKETIRYRRMCRKVSEKKPGDLLCWVLVQRDSSLTALCLFSAVVCFCLIPAVIRKSKLECITDTYFWHEFHFLPDSTSVNFSDQHAS